MFEEADRQRALAHAPLARRRWREAARRGRGTRVTSPPIAASSIAAARRLAPVKSDRRKGGQHAPAPPTPRSARTGRGPRRRAVRARRPGRSSGAVLRRRDARFGPAAESSAWLLRERRVRHAAPPALQWPTLRCGAAGDGSGQDLARGRARRDVRPRRGRAPGRCVAPATRRSTGSAASSRDGGGQEHSLHAPPGGRAAMTGSYTASSRAPVGSGIGQLRSAAALGRREPLGGFDQRQRVAVGRSNEPCHDGAVDARRDKEGRRRTSRDRRSVDRVEPVDRSAGQANRAGSRTRWQRHRGRDGVPRTARRSPSRDRASADRPR